MARRNFIRRAIFGRCQDCGRNWVPTRIIRFWVDGMRYRVCRDCEREYFKPWRADRSLAQPIRQGEAGS